MAKNKVTIFGAGISGLVAAINLARSGFPVEVIEKGPSIGGAKGWHPSVQFSCFNKEATSKFINIDLSPCFHKVILQRRYLYQKKIELQPKSCYLCERGGRDSSVESYLYGIALSEGVRFLFGANKNFDDMGQDGNVIIATGLEKENYVKLGIPYASISGFKAVIQTDLEPTYVDFFNKFTGYDLAYLAALNGMAYILFFSRGGLNEKQLELFSDFLMRNENLKSKDWFYSEGCVPLETNLTKNGFVLAGTISGMIDPFFLNGIPGAFVSGKIAADYFQDKESAGKVFRGFTRNFKLKNTLKSVYNNIPLKSIFFPFFCIAEGKLKGVGFI